ncbi:MAG TPA: lysylphosphatidylglycerol synthase transmembrane domain-containing protein [Halobacteriales archaeon]|nr:lysylphosphatidylglycerol synthase transmembrane domain-containing protein [Halobacteriales archaeon]
MDEPAAVVRLRRVGRRFAPVAVVLLVLAALLRVAGVEAVLASLAELRARDAAVLVVAGVLPLVFWGLELRLVLAGMDVPVGTARAVGLFVASGFLNNVTPFGEVGGDPPSGLLIAGVCRVPFERGLAAIASVNAVNRVAVLALGAAGVAWLGPDVGRIGVGWALVEVFAVWAVLFGVLLAAWVYREAIVATAGPPLAAAVVRVGRRLPFVAAPTQSSVEARIEGFVVAIERLAAEPRRLLVALLLGGAGHLAVAATLWLSLAALGVRTPVADLLVVIPLAKLSGLSPTPGGAGSAEVLLAGLLVGVAGVPTATAAAAALVYRAAAFWVPTAIGGIATAWFVGRIAVE